MVKTIAILVFDDVEELDAVGPYEVLASAAMERPDALKVFLVSETGGPVRCFKGISLLPHHSFMDAPKPDILVVPGGDGTRVQRENASLMSWVTKTAAGCELVASVCTGVRITLAAGIAAGKRITTHWSAIDEARASGEAADVLSDVRFVVDGNYVSSAGVSAGIDMALWMVGHLVDPAFARAIQHEIEYYPAPPYTYDIVAPR
ncbi:MAG: DJ-1/PfpI family protein [Pseudomonadota bacterium]